jgi:hypothetical protein
MSIVNGWLDWSERRDGVPDKKYSQPNSGEGIAMHSIVGQESEFQDGVPDRFLSKAKDANGRYTPYAAASCMFILRKNGTLIQMHPVTASTWTSGGKDGNTRFWAVEAEGGLNPYTEPLTKAAEDTFIRLVTEWEQHTGRKALPGGNLLQHKEIAKKFGYAATACASDRYSNALVRILAGERYEEDTGMTPAQLEEHEAIVAILGGREKLLAAAAAGMDYLLGYSIEQAEQNDLEKRVAALEAGNQPRVITIRGTNMEVEE